MCPSHFCRFRVTSHPSETYLKVFRIESESSHKELSSHFESLVCKLESMLSQMKFHIFTCHFFAMKWYPTCCKMMSSMLQNGGQCCFSKFDCRLFISKFFCESSLHLLLSITLSRLSKMWCLPSVCVRFRFFVRNWSLFCMTQTLQRLGLNFFCFSFFVLADVLSVYHLVGDQFRAHLLLKTRYFPRHYRRHFLLLHTIDKTIFSYELLLSIKLKDS